MTTYIHKQVERARDGFNKVIARMPSGWAVMGDTQFLRGYALLLPDPVVPTLNDLDESGRQQFLTDMARLGDAVLAACAPVRINYEMLGNLEPALHAHVFPRYADEPEDLRTKPVWLYAPEYWDSAQHAYDEAKHGEVRDAIRTALMPDSPVVTSPLWQRAMSFAARAHCHQIRKDGCTPYVAHPVRVAMTIRDVFGCADEATLAAALLHDTIEDTGTDFDDLLELAGLDVAVLVAAMTKDMRMPEAERETEYDRQLEASDWRARLLKLADVYDNLSDLPGRTRDASARRMIAKAERAVALGRRDAGVNPIMARAIRGVEAQIAAAESRLMESPRSGWED